MHSFMKTLLILICLVILVPPTSDAAVGGSLARAFVQIWKKSTVSIVKKRQGTSIGAGIAINEFENQFLKSYGKLSNEEFIARIRMLEGISDEHITLLEKLRRQSDLSDVEKLRRQSDLSDVERYEMLNNEHLFFEIAQAIERDNMPRLLAEFTSFEPLSFRQRDGWRIEPRSDTTTRRRVNFRYTTKNGGEGFFKNCRIENICFSHLLSYSTIELRCGYKSISISLREPPTISTGAGGITIGTQFPGL